MELIMHYVCIENNNITNILNYEPNVPAGVAVYQITDEQATQIAAQTHYFNVSSKTVTPVESSILAQKEQDKANAQHREFLRDTDWKVLRHIRQKALNLPTSLTEQEYLELEQQRTSAAASIV